MFYCQREIPILPGVFFYQPEARGHTYREIGVFYASHVSARKFKDYIVDGGVEDLIEFL